MDILKWKKVENEAGYPCYIEETTGKESYDHPQFSRTIKTLEEFNDIKYSAYRIAFKIYALQRSLKVPPLRISSGVFLRHQLSLSESSLSLDTTELEAVLADIYFAAEKEGLFSGDVDLAVDLLINLLLNIYDEERKAPIRVLAAKTLLILLSEESIADKWQALANCCADHNGCVSPRRLAALLVHVTALPKYLGCQCDHLQNDVDSCFEKSAGMLGVSARVVAEWATYSCASTRWLGVVQRVLESRSAGTTNIACAQCAQPLVQMLKFKCAKCNDVCLCEKCYLYDKDLSVSGHKKTHLVQEVINGEIKPTECLGFIKGMKRFFFCTKTRKKKCSKRDRKHKQTRQNSTSGKDKPAMVTSTVGRAEGRAAGRAGGPAAALHDIITNMESDTRALKELLDQLESLAKADGGQLKGKVDAHYNQISAQISRLKTLKETFLIPNNVESDNKSERPQAFDLFSPIPAVDEKQSKVAEGANQPRVLSLDSGNFSVTSRAEGAERLSASGALRPVVVHATSDSISTVSMNDVSNWHNEADSGASNKRAPKQRADSARSLADTQQRYAADLRAVTRGNRHVRELSADLDSVLDRLQQILTHNFAMDDSCFDNTQLRETANEMEGLLGTLIRGVEQRATVNADKGLV